MKRAVTLSFLAVLLATAGASAATPPAAPGHPMPWSPAWIVAQKAQRAFADLGRAGDPGFTVEYQDAAIDVDLDDPGFSSDVTVGLRSTLAATPTVYFYVMQPALVQSVTVGGVETPFSIEQGVVMLRDLTLTKDATTDVVIHLAGGLTCGGSSVYEDVCNFGDKVKYFFAYGWAIPVFYDWAGITFYVPGTAAVSIAPAHADLVGVSDGVFQGRQTLADRVVDTYAFDGDRISYQFLWGRFQAFEDTWEGVDVACVVEEGHAAYGPACVSIVKDILSFHSASYSKYPFSRMKVIDAGGILAGGYGAPMNIVLHSQVFDGFDAVFPGVVAHELGHQWWGGAVSFDGAGGIPATEGLAEFSACLYQETKGTYDHCWARHSGNYLYVVSAAQDRRLADPAINYAGGAEMTSLIYDKSPAVFRTLHRLVGDEAFFGALRNLVEAEPGSHSYKDLFSAFAAQGVSQDVIESSVRPWFEAVGHPTLALRLQPAADGALEAAWSQTGMDPPLAFRLPLAYDQGDPSSAGVAFLDITAAASGMCAAGVDGMPPYLEANADRAALVDLVPSAAGDADRNGVVDGFDLLLLARYTNLSALAGPGFANPLYSDAPDFDGDRTIGDGDLAALTAGFGKAVPWDARVKE